MEGGGRNGGGLLGRGSPARREWIEGAQEHANKTGLAVPRFKVFKTLQAYLESPLIDGVLSHFSTFSLSHFLHTLPRAVRSAEAIAFPGGRRFNGAMRPKIGVTCGLRVYEKGKDLYIALDCDYVDAVRDAGGRAVLIPPVTTREEVREIVSEVDGLLVTGGPDIPPRRYGQEPHEKTVVMHERRDFVDFECLRLADEGDLPLLAICLGIQELNVHRGGTLYQHLPEQMTAVPSILHRGDGTFSYHPVRVEPGSRLYSIVGDRSIEVNSSHHQGLHQLGRGLRPTAWSPDGLIEAVEDPRRRFMLGVQWHPEAITDRPPHRALFAALVAAARKPRASHR